ncbi:hypothetical protein IWQ60_006053 [Tieghemiomyces parasiticus]|uniref:Uncharacterized protein n=1 Tax=Tieghemiomyces parasiticus TaxID=78921 RepID=A0A9W8A8S3_9FUNG|nr:hypothetical protein IWQ60_006053 [Tieghemiomyces parasiticus]
MTHPTLCRQALKADRIAAGAINFSPRASTLDIGRLCHPPPTLASSSVATMPPSMGIRHFTNARAVTTAAREAKTNQVKLFDLNFLFPTDPDGVGATGHPARPYHGPSGAAHPLSVTDLDDQARLDQQIIRFFLRLAPDHLQRLQYLASNAVAYHETLRRTFLTQFPTVAPQATPVEWGAYLDMVADASCFLRQFRYAKELYTVDLNRSTIKPASAEPQLNRPGDRNAGGLSAEHVPDLLIGFRAPESLTQILADPVTMVPPHLTIVDRLFTFCSAEQGQRLLEYCRTTSLAINTQPPLESSQALQSQSAKTSESASEPASRRRARIPPSYFVHRLLTLAPRQGWPGVEAAWAEAVAAGIQHLDPAGHALYLKLALELNHPEVILPHLRRMAHDLQTPADRRLARMLCRGLAARQYCDTVSLTGLVDLILTTPHWRRSYLGSSSVLVTMFTALSQLRLWPLFNRLAVEPKVQATLGLAATTPPTSKRASPSNHVISLHTTLLHGYLKQGSHRRVLEHLMALRNQYVEPQASGGNPASAAAGDSTGTPNETARKTFVPAALPLDKYLFPLLVRAATIDQCASTATTLIVAGQRTPSPHRPPLAFPVSETLGLLKVYHQILAPEQFHTIMFRLYNHNGAALPLSLLLLFIKACFAVRDYKSIITALRLIEQQYGEPCSPDSAGSEGTSAELAPDLAVYLVLLTGYGGLRNVPVWTRLVRKLQRDRTPIPIPVYGAIMNAFNIAGDGVTVLRYYDHLMDQLAALPQAPKSTATSEDVNPAVPRVPALGPEVHNSFPNVYVRAEGGFIADAAVYANDEHGSLGATRTTPATHVPRDNGDPACRPDLLTLELPTTARPSSGIFAVTFNSLGFNNIGSTAALLRVWQEVRDQGVHRYPMSVPSYLALVRALGQHRVLPQYVLYLLEELRHRCIHLDHTSQRKLKRLLANHIRFYGEPVLARGEERATVERINELIGRAPARDPASDFERNATVKPEFGQSAMRVEDGRNGIDGDGLGEALDEDELFVASRDLLGQATETTVPDTMAE